MARFRTFGHASYISNLPSPMHLGSRPRAQSYLSWKEKRKKLRRDSEGAAGIGTADEQRRAQRKREKEERERLDCPEAVYWPVASFENCYWNWAEKILHSQCIATFSLTSTTRHPRPTLLTYTSTFDSFRTSPSSTTYFLCFIHCLGS